MSELRRLHVAARYSEAAVFNGVVYLAGMVPECDATDIAAQTADVLAQVDRRLAECGSDRTRILRTQFGAATGHGAGRAGRPRLAHRGRGHRGGGARSVLI